MQNEYIITLCLESAVQTAKGNMDWLDVAEAGPYNLTESNPYNFTRVEPNPEVTYKNLRWGKIGSTYDKAKGCVRVTWRRG